MRRISIRTSNAGTIELFDDTDEPIDEYCAKLSKMMKMNNIVTLQTSESSAIVRPSKIAGIQVKELFEESFSEDVVFENEVSEDIQEPQEDEQTEEIVQEEEKNSIQPETTPPKPEKNQEQKDKTEDIITDVD